MKHAFLTRDDGERVFQIEGGLDADAMSVIEAGAADSVWLGYGDWPDLGALQRAAGFIRSFRADPFGRLDLESVLRLQHLEVLEVCSFSLPARIAGTLGMLPRLRKVSIHWAKGLPSDFLMGLSAETVKLIDAPFHDVNPLLQAKRIGSLTLTRGRFRSLDGVSGIRGLRSLDAVLRKSTSLCAADINALEALSVISSRALLDSTWPLILASSLKHLAVDAGSKKWSVNKLYGLEFLESLNLGSHLRDIDLESILALPAIASLVLRGVKGARIDSATIHQVVGRTNFVGRISASGRATQLIEADRGEGLEIVESG